MDEESGSSDEDITELSDDEEEVEGRREELNNPNKEPKFIVFWSCLVSLFQTCFTCHQTARITKMITRGTLLMLTITCVNNHSFKWCSQPRIGAMAMGNLLLASSILYSGNTYTRIKEMMDMINLKFFGFTLYTLARLNFAEIYFRGINFRVVLFSRMTN